MIWTGADSKLHKGLLCLHYSPTQAVNKGREPLLIKSAHEFSDQIQHILLLMYAFTPGTGLC